jgi:hypothetical protein
MKTYFLLLISMTAMTMTPNKMQTEKAIGVDKGFAILELFTSEGCSSCPPADELFAKIQRQTAGKDIFILAYHVDYWDQLGWKDNYSNSDFSKRQLQYGHWLNISPIYTPQVIVNGKTQYVGSDEPGIRHAISAQLANKPVASLTIKVSEKGNMLEVEYLVSQVANDSRILIALVQKSAQSKVERGENAGRLLSHVQIVRKLQSEQLAAGGKGEVMVGLPKDFNSQYWEVVVFVQDQSHGEILAVAKAGLKEVANK